MSHAAAPGMIESLFEYRFFPFSSLSPHGGIKVGGPAGHYGSRLQCRGPCRTFGFMFVWGARHNRGASAALAAGGGLGRELAYAHD
jgi:hypothetical protein